MQEIGRPDGVDLPHSRTVRNHTVLGVSNLSCDGCGPSGRGQSAPRDHRAVVRPVISGPSGGGAKSSGGTSAPGDPAVTAR